MLQLRSLALFLWEEDKPASTTSIVVISLVLFAAGLLLLVLARNKFRQAGVIARLRNVALTDLSPGLVRITGKATGDTSLTSPISGLSCHSFQASAQERRGEGTSGSWRTINQHAQRQPFSFTDGTATVLVDPNGSEWDLDNTVDSRFEPNHGFTCQLDPALDLPQPSEKDLRSFLHADWTKPRPVPVAASVEDTEEHEKKRRWWMPTEIEIEGLGSIGLGEEKEIKIDGLGGIASPKVSAYTLTESCILPDRQYSIVGTCHPSADPGGSTRWVIKQGDPKAPFVLSSKPAEKMAGGVRKNAILLLGASLLSLAFAVLMFLTRHSWVEHAR